MQDCRLAAQDLACRRGERILFSGVNFALAAGEALQVTGANGVGKSSLLRIAAGLLTPFAGRIDAAGAVGLVDERPALDPQVPLGDALAFWRRIDRAPDHGHVDALGLGDLLDVPVRFLSTGQRKRAAMARLLMQQASIWLLDEPLNGLDSDAAALVERLAADHCAAGGMCMIASHQPFALAGMARLELSGFRP